MVSSNVVFERIKRKCDIIKKKEDEFFDDFNDFITNARKYIKESNFIYVIKVCIICITISEIFKISKDLDEIKRRF